MKSFIVGILLLLAFVFLLPWAALIMCVYLLGGVLIFVCTPERDRHPWERHHPK